MSGRDEAALARARVAARAELGRVPVAVPWQRQAVASAAALAGVGLAAVVATVAAGVAAPGEVAAHALTMVPLLALAAVGGVAALAPRARGGGAWQAGAIGGALVLMAALALVRGAGRPSTTPAWVCSVSHLGLGLIPLGFALAGLRQSAWTWPRALAAGLGAGTAGALLGEVACHQGARHVLVHHVGAWLVIALACVAISRRLRPRTFAP